MVDMNDSKSWAQAFKCYEKSGLGMMWTTLGRDLKALDFMKS